MVTAKKSEQRQSRKVVTDKSLERSLPTSVQKSYFMLSDAERKVFNTALEKNRPGQSEPILVGGKKLLKPALRLMRNYRLAIEEIRDSQAITSYTRWVDAVQVNGTENKEVYLTFSPRFEHIWLQSKKRLLEYVASAPANIGLRSQYALHLYSWAKKHVTAGTKRISLEQLRTVLGLDSVKNAEGNVIRQAPLPVWANLRQRALNVAIAEINKKTDLTIALKSLERSAHRRVDALIFAIKARTVSKPTG
jgi:plasmid replication initiation protein